MVDSRLINAKFVNYNDRAPPPSRLPDVTHVTLSPRPSPSVFILEAIKNWRWERPGNEANQQQLMYTSTSIPFSNSLVPRLRREPGNEVNAVMCLKVV